MLFSTAIFASLYASLAAAATTHTVKVADGGLKFNPPNLDAEAGDMVTFVFLAKNHSVTQSSFKAPCTPLAGGFDSGFVATKPNTTADFTNYTIMVTDTKPKWVFCAQASNVTGNHCHKGMVFSINPGNGNNTSADAYMQNAMALGVNDPPVVAAAAPVNGSSAAGPAATGGADAGSGASASGSGTFQFPSGTDSVAPGATPTDGSSASGFQFPPSSGVSGSAGPTDSGASSSAAPTDAVANAGASAAADQSSSGSASATSTAAGAKKSSGKKSVARRSMAALAAVGALLVLVL